MNDIINGSFEFLASLFILNHCRVLYKEKSVKGYSTVSTVFFFVWGLWNVYYYPSLKQDYSYYAGILVCVSNFLWISLQYYYIEKEKQDAYIDRAIDRIEYVAIDKYKKSKKKKRK